VTGNPAIREDLIVVSSRKTLITEEIDSFILDAGDVLFSFDVLQAVGLIPTSRENVK